MKYGYKCLVFFFMVDYLIQQNLVEIVFRMYDGVDVGIENLVNNKLIDC